MIVNVSDPVVMQFVRVKVLNENASGVPLSNKSAERVVVEPNFEESVFENVFQLAERIVFEHRRSLLRQETVGVPTDRRTAKRLHLIAVVVSAMREFGSLSMFIDFWYIIKLALTTILCTENLSYVRETGTQNP